jgi:hypothetical protein
MKGRCIFKTRKGWIGVAPEDAQDGDIVAVLRYSTIPLILRRRKGIRFELIGDAYIYGMPLVSIEAHDPCELNLF